MVDRVTKEVRSKIMAMVPTKGTKTELALRKAIWTVGLRGWKANVSSVLGRPDIAFSRWRIAVFVDGCFWHGCKKCKNIPESNREYWESHIRENKKRDRRIDRKLRSNGWLVIRFWEHELKENLPKCVEKVADSYRSRNTGWQPNNISAKGLYGKRQIKRNDKNT